MESYCNYVKYECNELGLEELLTSNRDEINKALLDYITSKNNTEEIHTK